MRLLPAVLSLTSLVVACGSNASDDSSGSAGAAISSAADLGTLVGSQVTTNGHNTFRLFDVRGPQIDEPGGTAFHHDETFSLEYVDRPGPNGFFTAAAEIEAFIQVDTVVVHHGGPPSNPSSVGLTIELRNNGNNTYRGTRDPISIGGSVGDSDTVVTAVEVAFTLHGGAIAEQAFQQNYKFVLD